MLTNEERIKDAYSKLTAYLENIETNEEYMKLLKFQAMFTNYSASNTMLIMLSKPNATYVAGYGAWKRMHRYVRKGERGIRIIAPCVRKEEKEDKNETELKVIGYRLASVFDISQTEGSEEELPQVVSGLADNGEITEDRFEELVNACPIPIELEGNMRAKGAYNTERKIIIINKDFSLLQQVKTLFHELAHYYCDVGGIEVKSATEECIAESVAFVVANRLGMDTSGYSLPYIKNWGGSLFTMQLITENVQNISRQILSCIEPEEEVNLYD